MMVRMPDEPKTPRQLTCVSTFTGLGGMDLGLEAAGFRHLASVEWDEEARRSIKANGKDSAWNLLATGDIEQVAQELDPSDLGLERGDLDLLVGAPPCQPYSKAAQWTANARKGLNDRRGQYLDDLLTLANRFLPKVVLLENVRGFVQGMTSAVGHIESWLHQLDGHYVIQHAVLDAVDYGVPQRRSRAIVVATRMSRPFEWPEPRERRVAWDALAGLGPQDEVPIATGTWAALQPSIPEGQNYLFHTDRGGGLPLSAIAPGTGPSSSSWRRPNRRGHCQPNQARRPVRSTGITAHFRFQRCFGSSPSPPIGRWKAHDALTG